MVYNNPFDRVSRRNLTTEQRWNQYSLLIDKNSRYTGVLHIKPENFTAM